jgi:eukaryotic-like serine/threonine-protein kinase
VTAAADTGHGPGIRFVRPIRYAGANFGSVDLVLRRDALDAAVAGARGSLIILSLIVMMAVILVGYLSGAMVARPLAQLRRALEDAAKSGFAHRISHRRRDEFGAAFEAFNQAAARLGAEGHEIAHEPEASLLATRIMRDAA